MGVYNRAQYSDQRPLMLQHWADYVEGLATKHKVIVEISIGQPDPGLEIGYIQLLGFT